jgi:hypothetical protein
MRHDSQYPLRQAHYVSHSTDFANRAFGYALSLAQMRVGRDYGNFGRNDIKVLNFNKK